MSGCAKDTRHTGALYLQRSPNRCTDSGDVIIKNTYVRLLKPFQIQGIRFLYDKYLKGGGAILNDDDCLGKTVQSVLFLFAAHCNSSTAKQSLILCNQDKQHHWLYHFNKWTDINASLFHQDCCTASVVIAPPAKCNLLNNNKWNVIIVDNLDPITYVKQIQGAKCSFKLWLADKNIKNDIKKLYKILHWMSCTSLGTQNIFESWTINNGLPLPESWQKRQYLNLVCNKWLLRRSTRDVKNQLPIFNMKEFKIDFQKWLQSHLVPQDNPHSDTNLFEKNTIQDAPNTNNELEDDDCAESSPSLLDLTLQNELSNKQKSDHSKIKSPAKKGRTCGNVDNTEPKTKICEKIVNSGLYSYENYFNNASTSLPCCEEDTKLSLEDDTVKGFLVNSVKLENIKVDESSRENSKFHLLDSLFSNDHRKSRIQVNIKQEGHSKDNSYQCNKEIVNNIGDSEKKTFKLLDRFFS